ncbi:MAG: OadG family protein [Bacteroidales bacterium]|nr:OadG family protein [Bacteroidales bacterium]
MENIQAALVLLLIGMIMVIIVLWLVVGLGNLLIRLTNKYVKEDKDTPSNYGMSRTGKNPKRIAAIIAAVDVATQGQGKIESINKNR